MYFILLLMSLIRGGKTDKTKTKFSLYKGYLCVCVASFFSNDSADVYDFLFSIRFFRVFELDGLKSGPINLGEIDGGENGDWLSVARPAIQARIEKYATSEIRFNLMGLVKNKKEVLTEQSTLLEARLAAIQVALADGGEAADMELEGDWALAQGIEALQAQLAETEASLETCKNKLSAEDEKIAGWKMENIRRKHNYIPFVVNLLRILAERNQLKPMIEKAKSKPSSSSTTSK